MRLLNAPPIVLRILFAIEGVLYLIAGVFLAVFSMVRPTIGYAMGWVDLLLGVVLLIVASKLPRLIAKRSPLPYLALAAILVVRLVNSGVLFLGEGIGTGAGVGIVIDLLLVAYLWSQVKRLQGAPVVA